MLLMEEIEIVNGLLVDTGNKKFILAIVQGYYPSFESACYIIMGHGMSLKKMAYQLLFW